MTRDELILVELLGGVLSTVELATATGISERVCRNGLTHLKGEDYVWSPARGRYRLTPRGRVIATDITLDAEPPEASPASAPAERAPSPMRRRIIGRLRE
jgi:DNA-binding HxlR family transcriptional regulator